MEELKQKYGIDDKAIFEIADSLEPDAEAPEIPPMGKERAAPQPASGAFPASLAQAMRGDISIAEALILMDFMDRKEDRRERRYGTTQPSQDTSNINKDILEEMREERRSHQEQIEKLILRKRADDAEERANRAEEDLKKKDEADRQREIVESAVQGAVSSIERQFGGQLDTLAQKVSLLPANQQKSFWDEMFTDFESDLRNQFKASVIERLKPPEKPLTKTDEEGKKSLDWEGLLDRGYKLADKWLDTGKTPPKLEVQTITTQPGAGSVPLEEPSAKAEEEPPKETPAAATPPIPPQDLTGIGPERAKKLSELGINDARQLAKVSSGYLKDELGVSKDKAEDIIKQAKELAEQA